MEDFHGLVDCVVRAVLDEAFQGLVNLSSVSGNQIGKLGYLIQCEVRACQDNGYLSPHTFCKLGAPMECA
jgi:hypothetical protein